MRGRNVTKPFTIGGFIFGEIYMLFVVLGNYSSGAPVPLIGKIYRVLGAFFFVGMCGAAVGLGIGLLVGALLKKRP